MTNSLLFLMVGALMMLVFAAQNNKQLKIALQKKSPHFSLLSKAITLLAITSQASEFVKVLEHVSPIKIFAALFLLVIVVALKSGTESELY